MKSEEFYQFFIFSFSQFQLYVIHSVKRIDGNGLDEVGDEIAVPEHGGLDAGHEP